MPLTADDLTRDNGGWLFRDSGLDFRILADDATPLMSLLQSLVNRSDSICAGARAHAESTPYASDIRDGNGISPASIHIDPDSSYCIWFQLIEIPHRYLAVKFVDDAPVDVYCDHP